MPPSSTRATRRTAVLIVEVQAQRRTLDVPTVVDDHVFRRVRIVPLAEVRNAEGLGAPPTSTTTAAATDARARPHTARFI